jgi:hypothetical protein
MWDCLRTARCDSVQPRTGSRPTRTRRMLKAAVSDVHSLELGDRTARGRPIGLRHLPSPAVPLFLGDCARSQITQTLSGQTVTVQVISIRVLNFCQIGREERRSVRRY